MSGMMRSAKVSWALALVGALLFGIMLAQSVSATPVKTDATIKDRVQAQRDLCEIGGGKLDVTTGYLSTTTKCNGGDNDGYTCVNTRDTTDCHKAATQTPTSVQVLISVDPGENLVYVEPSGQDGKIQTVRTGAVIVAVQSDEES